MPHIDARIRQNTPKKSRHDVRVWFGAIKLNLSQSLGWKGRLHITHLGNVIQLAWWEVNALGEPRLQKCCLIQTGLPKSGRDSPAQKEVASRKLTYPTWRKGKSSTQKCLWKGICVSSLEGSQTSRKFGMLTYGQWDFQGPPIIGPAYGKLPILFPYL